MYKLRLDGLTYLASPYSVGNADEAERERRFRMVCCVARRLMERGEAVFCPIAHSHPIEIHGDLPVQGHDFWLAQDFAVLKHCARIKVLELPGVDNTNSVGIGKEIQLAVHIGIPVYHIRYEEVIK